MRDGLAPTAQRSAIHFARSATVPFTLRTVCRTRRCDSVAQRVKAIKRMRTLKKKKRKAKKKKRAHAHRTAKLSRLSGTTIRTNGKRARVSRLPSRLVILFAFSWFFFFVLLFFFVCLTTVQFYSRICRR